MIEGILGAGAAALLFGEKKPTNPTAPAAAPRVLQLAPAPAQLQLEQRAQETPRQPTTGAVHDEILDLAAASWPEVGTTARQITYVPEGSTAGGRIDLVVGSKLYGLSPGDQVTGYFERFQPVRSANSATVGTAVLRVTTAEGIGYSRIPNNSTSGLVAAKACGPGGTTTQTVNSAAGNVPTTAGDGISLRGVRGLRVSIAAATLLSGAGNIVLWRRSSSVAGGAWVRGNTSYAVDSTLQFQAFNDELVSVPDGEVYPEAVSVTATGVGLTLTIETWG